MSIRIFSYNVNGIRSAISKGLMDWVAAEKPDIICFQEIKADHDSIANHHFEDMGYQTFWFPAQKKGYSGVGIVSKIPPQKVVYGCNNPLYDAEGRFITLHFSDFSVISVYHPSGSSGDERQAFKMQWLDYFSSYMTAFRKQYPRLVVSGDYNICNKAIDIHNPVSNAKSSGFLPEERKWFDDFLASGYVDSFRMFNSQPGQYTWWSFRAGARGKNLGWRIDYNLVTDTLKDKLLAAGICPDAKHSDHCPAWVELAL